MSRLFQGGERAFQVGEIDRFHQMRSEAGLPGPQPVGFLSVPRHRHELYAAKLRLHAHALGHPWLIP
jgi:hypothetical protein